MVSKIRSRIESRLEAGKLCGWRPGAQWPTSHHPGPSRINPAAAKNTLHQINVKGFASRPNGGYKAASRLLSYPPKNGPTLDINLVPRGWPLTGLMLTDQCSQSIPQTRGSDFGVQQRSGEQLSQLRQTGFIWAEDEPDEQRRSPQLVRAKEYVPGGYRDPGGAGRQEKIILPPARG